MNNITNYRKSLKFVEELGKLEELMRQSLSNLEKYKKYIPAQECISIISDQLIIVQVHLNHQKKIKESKGAE